MWVYERLTGGGGMIQFQKLQPKGDTVVDHTPLPKVAITTECGLTPTWLHSIGQGLCP
ncbi:hypothetical protein QG37_06792 [Candidozyma auris]|nr:hypothetical protein QG37_06792 [[Candida] auris]